MSWCNLPSFIILKIKCLSPDGRGFYFDVFDSQGRFITKVPLNQVSRIPLVWKRGKLNIVEEDYEGFLDVKMYKVTWKN